VLAVVPWTVDYGSGPREIAVPHAWRQDVDVRWEGPAIYRTTIDVPIDAEALVFEGVSYQAKVSLNGETVAEHCGIWDAFTVDLTSHRGERIDVEVEVVKNGGPTFPVRDVASGFLPYVFHTFGGIFRPVWIRQSSDPQLIKPAASPGLSVERSKLFVDGNPFYARGVLTWGWYPELGHCHPSSEIIEKEIRQAKELGFNLIKFCLWIPPHEFLEKMKAEGLYAWMELPLWDPSPDPVKLEAMKAEMRRIVEQYEHHDNILFWTCGCELSDATPAEYRHSLVEMVREITGSPAIKDNSGGAEMYGGDPREIGDFYDYHPYCDTPFYGPVLESLSSGARKSMPILLGEFNDLDLHRHLHPWRESTPHWASSDPFLNDQGVRWQHDLPNIILGHKLGSADSSERSRDLLEVSESKSRFVRKYVQENVRRQTEIAGYVVTGWRDTPISTSGFLDDFGEIKNGLRPDGWNGDHCAFLMPKRRPPWVNGGNRPGWQDDYNHFVDQAVLWTIGMHSISGIENGRAEWTLQCGDEAFAAGAFEFSAPPCQSQQIGAISVEPTPALIEAACSLRLSIGGAETAWPISFHEKLGKDFWDKFHVPLATQFPASQGGPNFLATSLHGESLQRWRSGQSGIVFLQDECCVAMPFWRESALEPTTELGKTLVHPEGWHRLLAVSPDCALDTLALEELLLPREELIVHVNRVDVRTYAEHAYVVELIRPNARLIVTTLRPQGGLGIQPFGLQRNAAGHWLMKRLSDALASV
jgi:hypothetical protein